MKIKVNKLIIDKVVCLSAKKILLCFKMTFGIVTVVLLKHRRVRGCPHQAVRKGDLLDECPTETDYSETQ